MKSIFPAAHDLGETKNLADDKPERAKALGEKLASWRASLNAPMPR
jgi:hypothetical protein